MKNLEKFLRAYELNLEYFDLDEFLDDIMDICYQIEVLETNFNHLTTSQKEKFLKLNSKLEQLLKTTEPKHELHKKVIEKLKVTLQREKEKNHLKSA